MKPYDLVRVRMLLQPAQHYDGWKINVRTPKAGDIGTVVDVAHAEGLPGRYIVEMSAEDGVTVWLGDFAEEELVAFHGPRLGESV